MVNPRAATRALAGRPPGRTRARLWAILAGRTRRPPSRSPRRRPARLAVLVAAALVGATTLALAVAVETVKPEWRDPEYGYRVKAARRLQEADPTRPMVLVVGSSRAQLGVSPADMGFAEEPGSPLLYNFGYRAASPVWALLQAQRAAADGLRPRAVLAVIAIQEFHPTMPGEIPLRRNAASLSGRDVARVAPYVSDPAHLYRTLAAARLNPWGARLPAVVRDLAPGEQDFEERLRTYHWNGMDRYGYVGFPIGWIEPLSPEQRRDHLRPHDQAVNDVSPGAVADHGLRGLVAWCRERGIAVAAAWAPESPAYRAMYAPPAKAKCDALTRALTGELGIPVFPAPDLPEADFADGYHLVPPGAAKYSRWLADNHLRPWLAEATGQKRR